MTSTMRGWVAAAVIVIAALLLMEDPRTVVLWPARVTLRFLGW